MIITTFKGEIMQSNKKKRSSRNLKIPTRVTISTIVAIVLPLLIVTTFSSIFLNTMASYFNVSAVTTDTYSMLNQIQWSQTMSEISNELITDDDLKEKENQITKFVAPLEEIGSFIHIDRNGDTFYSTTNSDDTIKLANSIVRIDTDMNMNYFGENGIVIVTHAENGDDTYTVVIANGNYYVHDISSRYTAQDFSSLVLGKTGVILTIVAAVFVLSILILSFITSRTISKPIKLLADGANEIANGNLDYVINYESTNEIGTTVSAFNDMTVQLKSAVEDRNRIDESRKEMIAGVAHDLRTPLTSVKGYVEGLMDGIASTDEMKVQYLQTIYSSTQDMERLLDELLTLSRLELGNIALECENININSFLNDYCEDLVATLRTKDFDFEYINPNADKKIMVSLDTDHFVRVISNIVSNSVKYSKKDTKGKITLSLDDYEKSIILSVTDNGIGIENDNVPKIFDSFFRADQARTKVRDGSGIGLAVCKQIIERHGGKIWATSQYGIGTTIYISLNKILEDNDE